MKICAVAISPLISVSPWQICSSQLLQFGLFRIWFEHNCCENWPISCFTLDKKNPLKPPINWHLSGLCFVQLAFITSSNDSVVVMGIYRPQLLLAVIETSHPNGHNSFLPFSGELLWCSLTLSILVHKMDFHPSISTWRSFNYCLVWKRDLSKRYKIV